MNSNELYFDVAVVGGGPGGSTLGSILRNYSDTISVGIFEREVFPRDHIGESQLPPIGDVLAEIGAWDKIEAANFPIKIGATFRWGHTPELWDFEFLPLRDFVEEPRPAKYEGQRKTTAFQVDRSIYDDILLKHSAELGCSVFQNAKVTKVNIEEDEVQSLVLADGRIVKAKYFIDASGNAAVIRKAAGVNISAPTSLQNVAFWDYWQNTEWTAKIGVGGTRILIMSIGFGWIWFIPLGPTRTSIGLVCPATYYKESKKSPEELYQIALDLEPTIAKLTQNATRENQFTATKDWSFISDRTHGKNWFLVGEAAGFADPILSAGMTLTHWSAREMAYIILEMERNPSEDPSWMIEYYDYIQKLRITQHMRFAEFWYSANGEFTDLTEYTTKIAKDAGLDLNPAKAFKWIAAGGFVGDNPGQVGLGGYDLAGVKQIAQLFVGEDEGSGWMLNEFNIYRLNVDGASKSYTPSFHNGQVGKHLTYERAGKKLQMSGLFKLLADNLKAETEIATLIEKLTWTFKRNNLYASPDLGIHHALQTLETMVQDGWVVGRLKQGRPRLKLETPNEGDIVHRNRDASLSNA